MSVLTTILGERRATKFASSTLADPVLVDIFGASANTAAGKRVDESTALGVSAVYACVRNISEDVAKLPLFVYRRLPRGKEKLPDHPLFRLLHDQPNEDMTSFDLRETVQGWALIRGNGYAEIPRDAGGRPRALLPMASNLVEPKRLETDGRLVYLVNGEDGKPDRVLEQFDVFHLRGLGGDGVSGWSVLKVARETIGLALGAEEFTSRFFGNNAQPGGVLEHPATLSDDAYNRLRDNWHQRYGGLENAHKPAILEEGMKWQSMGIPSEDAELLESRRFTTEEIARFYRMPLHKISNLDKATFSNIEQQNLDYVVDTLMTWLVRWEQEIKRKLIMPGEPDVFAEHNVTALLRGDMAARAAFYKEMFQVGALAPNDILDLENMNPGGSEGDQRFVPMNMQTLELATATDVPAEEEPDEPEVEPGDEPDDGEGDEQGGGEEDSERGQRLLQRLSEVHGELLSDAWFRVLRIEADKVERAAKRGGFREWAESFFGDEHVAHVRATIGSSVDAAAGSLWPLLSGQVDAMPAELRESVLKWTADVARKHVTGRKAEYAFAEGAPVVDMDWCRRTADLAGREGIESLRQYLEGVTDDH